MVFTVCDELLDCWTAGLLDTAISGLDYILSSWANLPRLINELMVYEMTFGCRHWLVSNVIANLG